MKTKKIDPNILNEESQTIKWFIVLFYIISISYDLIYSIISKYNPILQYKTPDLLGLWIYVFMFALIPVARYLYKNQRQHQIKYVYFISYTTLTLINDVISFIGKPEIYKSGNAVEILWLLLSPIFVSNTFFKVVSLGLLLKYSIAGLIIQTPNVLSALLLLAVLSIFSFIILNRFQSYVRAIKTSYDQQLVGLVKGVIATLELKDPYTRGHSERVASYALELAKINGKFSVDDLKDFNYACLLHDIGKIHIPDRILMKPGRLTNEEYEIIKAHTVVGAEAVSKIVGFKHSIEVIRSHHERWDGKGYPDQLKGEEIPYLARVSAIADAFDAMTSTRSYRSALSVEEAYKRILEGKGSQFDPELVDNFQKVFPKWKKIHDSFNEEIDKIMLHNNFWVEKEVEG
ncbi:MULTISPECIES: HD-GYP domain-containing protein [Neobacillus]|uniref:HD-GYP domain-containing protein n=1 Tax=Neobacillus rhizophilus TaxID=2833579 RepID=A0A942YV79_9BACI|nr:MULTISPECIES: HD-GYP domain-containing protein [Neobacillus]MBS4213657.1 HD-GYP domain-containing protein [Neobacillus rhizophilus]MBU8917937.1 HD-GYP domain-containing protein [Bacillus sp. FJAT-29953]